MSDITKEIEDQPTSFAQEVWKKLSTIDVGEHQDEIEGTDKRPAVSYLPWHKAWLLLKREFPGSEYRHDGDIIHPDNTVEVQVTLIIGGDTGIGSVIRREIQNSMARLPVMDQWFNAISNPNARDISDSRQRCLVKAIAYAGLGLNLWSKEESHIPVGKLDEPINAKQVGKIMELIEAADTDTALFLEWAGVDKLDYIPRERYNSAIALLESRVRAKSDEKTDPA